MPRTPVISFDAEHGLGHFWRVGERARGELFA